MTPKKEPLIIDMRNAKKDDLLALSRLLLTLNSIMHQHGFKVTVKKTKASPLPLKSTLA